MDNALRPKQTRFVPAVAILLIAVATLSVYGQVIGHGFLSYDDPLYVKHNRVIQAGVSVEGVHWALTTGDIGNWHPLTWLSHMLDVTLFGMDPGMHHLANVIIHLANTLLLLLLLWRMTGAFGRSAFVAALFALHPLHVESVAWISERKDVLSGLFFTLTLLAYGRYCRKPGRPGFLAIVLLFAAGLMAKPMLVTLPFILLLLDYWPLRRMRPPFAASGTGASVGSANSNSQESLGKLAAEKIPLFLLSLVSCVVTAFVQDRGGAVKSLEAIPLGARLLNIPVAYVRYLGKTFWPARLAVEYPHPGMDLPLFESAAMLLLLVIVSLVAIREARRHPPLFVGWFWFLGMMVPVIGLIQVGGQAMADRYTYLPLIGIFVAFSWTARELTAAPRFRAGLPEVAAVAVLAALAAATYRQTGYWRDSVTLYRHALEVNPGSSLILTNMGGEMGERGNFAEAIRFSREALAIEPARSDARYNLAYYLELSGNHREAAIEYGELLRRYPDDREAAANLARTLERIGSGRAR